MIPEELPPQMPQAGAPEMGGEEMPPQAPPMPPDMGGIPSDAPPMPPEMGGMPPEEGLMNMESDALQMDEVSSNEDAVKLITKAKKAMYGERFDKYMEVLQVSDNIVEDLAMVSLDLIIPSLNANGASNGGRVPFDHIMDASAEVVSEAYDMAVQTGVYAPSSEQELERNQNITLTMVAGELGKTFSTEQQLPQDRVSQFIETVMDGHYDNYIDPEGAGTESLSPEELSAMIPQEQMQGPPMPPQGPPMEGPPMGGPPMGGPPMPPQAPMGGPPMSDQPMPPQEGLING